jgi:hypothetical protein
MSKAHLPPVPPANRSPKGGGARPGTTADIPAEQGRDTARNRDRNLAQQGRQGNIAQNTNNQGRQQDR